MFHLAYWIFIVLALPMVLAITALVLSLRTQRQLEQQVKRLEWLIQTTQPLSGQQSIIQPPVTQAESLDQAVNPQDIPSNSNINSPTSVLPPVYASVIVPPTTPIANEPLQVPSVPSNRPNWPDPARSHANLEPDEQSLNIVTSIWHSLLQWFRGGNAIVRVGVIILLVGVVLLLRLANELFTVPIEVRLGAVAVSGVGLTLLGLRLRQKRRGYAISIQGAGLAIVYLTLFAAFRLYEVLPASLTFVLLAILAVVSAALALMQNALPLALLAFGGGFLAPLLTSTGSNNLVGLFSYYLILNIALAGLAHYKTWKVLNVLGALMTFGVAGYVGWTSYDISMRWALEGLLLAHLGLYLFIVVRYSQQLVAFSLQSNHNAQSALAPVDSTLLFGVPLMGFALQAGLMRDIPYALALSSALLSGIYLVLGYQLFYRNKNLMLLTEGVLALGVGFMALVIPLALDAKWTAVGWAVQGTALVWLGQRQHRIWSVRFGLLLQALTAITIIWISFGQHAVGLPLLVYSVCLFITALLLRQETVSQPVATQQQAKVQQPWIYSFVVLLAAFIASQFTLIELEDWWLSQHQYWLFNHLTAGFYPLIFTALTLIASWRLQWFALEKIHQLILIWLTIYAGLIWLDYASLASSKDILWLLATGYIALGALKIWRNKPVDYSITPDSSVATSHFEQAVWVIGVLIFSSTLMQLHWMSQPLVAMIIPPLVILLYIVLAKHLILDISKFALLHNIALPMTAVLLYWLLCASWLSDGQMLGLVYIPLINLLDICMIITGFIAYRLMAYIPRQLKPIALGSLGVAAFVALTGIVIRTLHQWAHTPLWDSGAWHSDLVQTSLTIVWTLCALILTGIASKFAWRHVWLAGIALLAIVVVKLLLIDLSNAATIARIVSFIGAGLIMLLIGYIAPLPPAIKPIESTDIKDNPDDKHHEIH